MCVCVWSTSICSLRVCCFTSVRDYSFIMKTWKQTWTHEYVYWYIWKAYSFNILPLQAVVSLKQVEDKWRKISEGYFEMCIVLDFSHLNRSPSYFSSLLSLWRFVHILASGTDSLAVLSSFVAWRCVSHAKCT